MVDHELELRAIKKAITLEEYKGEVKLSFKGESQKKIGEGSYRIVFDIPNTPYVAKVEYDDDDGQAINEYKVYKKLNKSEYSKHIAKTLKPFRKKVKDCDWKKTMLVTLQEKVPGKLIMNTRSKKAREQWTSIKGKLSEEFGVSDLHDENAAWCGKTKIVKFFDLGRS